MALRAISLFTGGGGLDLGLSLAGVVTVCRVEHEAYTAAVLAARSEDGSLDPAPVWSDVSTFDGFPWNGLVDVVFGGFPCTDISSSGLKAGIEGERSGLWSEFARIVREVGPRFVFVENVSALLVRGFDRVLGDLAGMGFDAEWGLFTATGVGAPHQRERLFLLAHANGQRGQVSPARRLAAVEGAGGYRPPMGYPPGPGDDFGGWLGPQPVVRRGTDGLAYRAQRLRILGNGVVPEVAAHAWQVLFDRIGGVK